MAVLKFGSETIERIALIASAWRNLGLGDVDARAHRALENRIREGATVDELEAAVVGAGACEWLRRRAKVPFAVVFASRASVERFAHEGRKIADASAERVRAPAHRERRERREPQLLPLRSTPTTRGPELLLPRPTPLPSPLPLSAALSREEFLQRRTEELARFEAWARGQQ